MRSQFVFALAALVTFSFVTSRADAAPTRRGARVTWVRGIDAERCVGQLALEEDVKARLGYDPFVLASDVIVEGSAVRSGTGFRAELVVRDSDGKVLGTRRLVGREADCRGLGDAIAVAITVAIDPETTGVRPTLVEDSLVPNSIPGEPLPPPPLVPPPPPKIETGHAQLAFGASAGILPDFAVVTSLRSRAVLGAWSLGAGAHFWPESRAAGLGFGLTSASLDACFAPLRTFRGLRWCAGGDLGLFQVFVHDPNLAPVEVGMYPWAAAETGPAISIPLVAALHLEAGISAIVPITRRQAFLRGQSDPTWEQSVVGGRADIGLGLGF